MMTTIHRLVLPALFSLPVAVLSGCGGGGGGATPINVAATGFLGIGITDAPVDDVSVVNVQFTGVTLKPQNGEQMEFVFDTPRDFDLLTLTGGVTSELLKPTIVPVGRYEWLRLAVNADFDTVFDSYAMTPTGQVELRVPSGSQSGLKLVSGFTVTQNQSTNLVIDWDLRKALTDPPGQPGLHLRPALRVTDMAAYGTLTGMVTNNEQTCPGGMLAETGNAVYVYTGTIDTAGDIGDATADPLTTATISQNESGDYTYEVNFLSVGDYSAAFTCEAGIDDAEVDQDIVISVPQAFSIEDGSTAVVNF